MLKYVTTAVREAGLAGSTGSRTFIPVYRVTAAGDAVIAISTDPPGGAKWMPHGGRRRSRPQSRLRPLSVMRARRRSSRP
jgi:hypothetical protein